MHLDQSLFISAIILRSAMISRREHHKRIVSLALALQSLLLIRHIVGVTDIHTRQSRLAWAFSRDRGFPFSKYLDSVAKPPFKLLDGAFWMGASMVVGVDILRNLVVCRGSSLAFNSFVSGGMILQNISYSIPIILLLCPNGGHGWECVDCGGHLVCHLARLPCCCFGDDAGFGLGGF